MSTSPTSTNKLTSIHNIHWVAALVTALLVSFLVGLIALLLTNEWAIVIVAPILMAIVAIAVGFAVRFTSANGGTGAFVAGALATAFGVSLIVTSLGREFDNIEYTVLSNYFTEPTSLYVFFWALVGGIVATLGRRP